MNCIDCPTDCANEATNTDGRCRDCNIEALVQQTLCPECGNQTEVNAEVWGMIFGTTKPEHAATCSRKSATPPTFTVTDKEPR